MAPEEEVATEEAVVKGAREAFLLWVRYVGSIVRTCKLACAAEDAGLDGAVRLIPPFLYAIDPESEDFQRSLRTGVERGLATKDEVRDALGGE